MLMIMSTAPGSRYGLAQRGGVPAERAQLSGLACRQLHLYKYAYGYSIPY